MTDYRKHEHTPWDIRRNLFTCGHWGPEGDHPEVGHVIIGMRGESQLMHPIEAWDIGLLILERALQAWGYEWGEAWKITEPLRHKLVQYEGEPFTYYRQYEWFTEPRKVIIEDD